MRVSFIINSVSSVIETLVWFILLADGGGLQARPADLGGLGHFGELALGVRWLQRRGLVVRQRAHRLLVAALVGLERVDLVQVASFIM